MCLPDDDFISATPDTKKAKKTVSPSENKVGAANQIKSKQKEKEKEMSAKDFFGGATDDKKRKRRNDEKKEVDDVPEKKKSPEKSE